jgi:hypothetical protein
MKVIFLLSIAGHVVLLDTITSEFPSRVEEVVVLSFDEAETLGITDEELSKKFTPRQKLKLAGRKERKELDKRQVEEWLAFWYSFDDDEAYRNLPLVIYHKLYFDENGNISYFLYHLKYTREGSPIDTVGLHNDLNNHIQTYQFDLAIGEKWSQCGSWTLGK